MIIRTSDLRKEFDATGCEVNFIAPEQRVSENWRVAIIPFTGSYFVAFKHPSETKARAAFDAICEAMEKRPGATLDLRPFEK